MKKLRIMAIGAHPDDCDFSFGGTAIKFREAGHQVMFLSMTNGCSGHQTTPGAEMSAKRFGEAQAVSALTGIKYKMTDIPDGSLTADLRTRDLLMREIRAFKPDIIITHRPNDYHPDHRNTGILVMDCSYLVIVPHVTPDSPPLRQAPYIFHVYDNFTFPAPFVPQVAVSIDDAADKKTAMLNCHGSQVYEWLPWAGGYLFEVPPETDPKGRMAWLKAYLKEKDPKITESVRKLLVERYGKEKGKSIRQCELFQLCEYGRQDTIKKVMGLFPL